MSHDPEEPSAEDLLARLVEWGWDRESWCSAEGLLELTKIIVAAREIPSRREVPKADEAELRASVAEIRTYLEGGELDSTDFYAHMNRLLVAAERSLERP